MTQRLTPELEQEARELSAIALEHTVYAEHVRPLLGEIDRLRAELAGAEERGRQKERADVLHEARRTARTSTLDGDGAFDAFVVRIQRGDHVRTGTAAADGGESQP